ncbi:MAG: ATP-binding protein [Candidatus Bathyarchaeia archaeon]
MKASDYGLKRPSFQLDPELDAEIFVGRDDVKERLESRLKRAIATGTSMHTVIYGDYGSGKTHTLNYIYKFLYRQKLDVLPIFVRQPRITKKSDPSDLYASIINAISMTEIFDLFVKIYDSVQDQIKDVPDLYRRVDILRSVIGNRDLAFIVYRYVTTRPSEDYIVVKWLFGEKLSAREKATLNVISDNSDPFNAAQTLLTLFRLFNKFARKYVLLMLDEMESLAVLGDRRKELEFQEFLRVLVDETKNVGVIIAFTTKLGIEDAPEMFKSTSPIGSRIGYPQNYIWLKEFNEIELTKNFVKELIKALRDEKIDVAKLVEKYQSETNENLSIDFYPFTEEAIEVMFEMSTQSGQVKPLLPRDIQKALTDALGDAMIQNKPFVDSEIMSRIMST